MGSAEDERAEREIVDGTIRYCWAIDERDWPALSSVFLEDAVAEFGYVPPLKGLEAIAGYIASVLEPLDGSQHMVSNHQVRVDGAHATSRCYFHAQHMREAAADGPNYIVAGVYRDEWVQTAAGWRIRHRSLDILWTDGNPGVVQRASDAG